MAKKRNPQTLKSQIRQIGKSLATNAGALTLYHRVRHREALTVLMFHRVLPPDLISHYGADDEYTISTNLLTDIMAFVAAHYSVVSLDAVLKSRLKVSPLPSRPLLVTFDDGWNDNALFAAPILRRLNVPWALFVATGAIETGSRWWQETLLATWRSGNISHEALKQAALNVLPGWSNELPNDKALSLLVLFGSLPAVARDKILIEMCGNALSKQQPRDMASWETLKKLYESGVAIGGHGTSHLPLTLVSDPLAEISQCRSTLQKQLGMNTGISMSFPHGRYNATLVEIARQAGVQLLFTSDAKLNRCPGGWLGSDLLGRISIASRDVTGPLDEMRVDRLMPWLMLRRDSEA
jgi:peptidoglycan/xylan/chitin deacetylase (PgdA/CDA1 family)